MLVVKIVNVAGWRRVPPKRSAKAFALRSNYDRETCCRTKALAEPGSRSALGRARRLCRRSEVPLPPLHLLVVTVHRVPRTPTAVVGVRIPDHPRGDALLA